MPVALVPPQPISYPGGVLPLTARGIEKPKEGPKTVPLSIKWATDGGPNNSVYVNLKSSQSGLVSLSQIITLYVDNIVNSQSVTFVFPDTQFVLEIPRGTFGYFPVITTGLHFTVFSPGASGNDITRINVLNYFVDPSAISQFAFADVPSGNVSTTTLQVTANANQFVQLVPIGTEGILDTFKLDGTGPLLMFAFQSINACAIQLMDSAFSTVYWATEVQFNGQIPYINFANLFNLNIPFYNGLTLRTNQAATGTSLEGILSPFLTYRAPS